MKLPRKFFLASFLGVSALVGVFVFILFFRQSSDGAQTFVLLSDPVLVISRSRETRIATVVSVPSSLSFDGVRGYGRYSLSALYTLGSIDHVGGLLVRETLSEALAIPIDASIGFKDERLHVSQDSRISSTITSFFCGIVCVKNILLNATFITDMTFFQYVQATFLLYGLSESDLRTIDVTEKNITQNIVESDGMQVAMFDTKKYDSYFPNVFENNTIREEALRIRVVNATTTSGLGERFSRRLSRIGSLIISVESAEDRELLVCEIMGTKEVLRSKTAEYVQKTYGCTKKEVVLRDPRADLTIRVGAMYARRYLPLQEVPLPTPLR